MSDFIKKCYQEMVRKDPFAAALFAIEKVPKGQQSAWKKMFLEEVGKK